MRTEALGSSYLALPDGPGPFPGVVVVHEASGLNDNIRDICGRFAAEGYAALGVDLFEGRSRAVCMARMFASGMSTSGAPITRPRRPIPGRGSWPFSPGTSGEARRDRARARAG